MFLRLGPGEIAFICILAALAIALPAFLVYLVSKLSQRLRDIEEKLKDK